VTEPVHEGRLAALTRAFTGERVSRAVIAFVLLALAVARFPGDRWPALAWVAYVPPAPCALLALAALATLRRRGAPRTWVLLGALALALSVVTTAGRDAPLVVPRARDGPPGLVLVHWNVAHGQGVAAVRSALPCDVLCLTEPAAAPDDGVAALDSRTVWRSGSILVAAPAGVERRAVIRGPGLRALHVVVPASPPLSLVLVDVASSPLLPRARPLGALRRALQDLDPPPDLVLGDFNTPAGSATLEEALAGLPDAYDLAGVGLGETWPVPLPLLRLDQVRARPDLDLLRYDTGAGWSDHRWQRVVLARAPGRSPACAARPER
jgi:hypothetical protein